MSLKYVLPVLAASATVFAQNKDCSNASGTTIQNAADATALASKCETFSGNVAFATGVTGDVAIAGIKEITGDFSVVSNHNIGSIQANDLEKVGGTFHLEDDTNLRSLALPKLKSVKTINWVSNAILSTLDAKTEISEVTSVTIKDSRLNNFAVFSVDEPETFVVANNGQLKELVIKSSKIKKMLDISANNGALNVSFPNLKTAGELNFRTISMVTIPALTNVSGPLGFYESSFEKVSAPNLTSVGSLTFQKNSALSSLDFSKLKSAKDDLRLSDNTKLLNVSFPALETVGGAVDAAGNFTDFELPKVTTVDGNFNLQSSANINETCNHYNGIKGINKVLKGSYQCLPEINNPKTLQNGGDKNGNGKNGNNDTGAASRTSLTAFVGLTGLVMYLLL